MSASQPRRRTFDPGVLRRLVHLVIFVGVIVGVRSCGGGASAEDQLSTGTQWIANRTGLAAVKDDWDRSIRPRIASVTDTASNGVYGAVSGLLDSAENARAQGVNWVNETTTSARDAIVSALRRIFGVSREPPPPLPRPNAPPRQPPQTSPVAP
jgi:hypothetical protein